MSKLDGIKAGDRVRVTFEGMVDEKRHNVGVRIRREADIMWVGCESNASDDHFQITRIDPPLSVSDNVLILGAHKGRVIGFLSDGQVSVEYLAAGSPHCAPYHPSCLTRA